MLDRAIQDSPSYPYFQSILCHMLSIPGMSTLMSCSFTSTCKVLSITCFLCQVCIRIFISLLPLLPNYFLSHAFYTDMYTLILSLMLFLQNISWEIAIMHGSLMLLRLSSLIYLWLLLCLDQLFVSVRISVLFTGDLFALSLVVRCRGLTRNEVRRNL